MGKEFAAHTLEYMQTNPTGQWPTTTSVTPITPPHPCFVCRDINMKMMTNDDYLDSSFTEFLADLQSRVNDPLHITLQLPTKVLEHGRPSRQHNVLK